jgi:serralysin
VTNNLVMISVDDLFAYQKFRTTFGVEIQTPNMDRLSALGTTFDAAYVATPLCGPSRAAILTGQTPFETGVLVNWDTSKFDRAELLPTALHDAGMVTALFGKVFHSYPAAEYAEGMIDILVEPTGLGRKTSEFDGGEIALGEPADAAYADYITIQNSIDVVNDYAGGNAPFAIMAGLRRPHKPWDVPQRYYDLYPIEDIIAAGYPDEFLATLPPFALQFGNGETPRGSAAKAIQAYLASVSFADAQIGRLLDTLDEKGLWDTTTVVLWSDHGYSLGDHDHWGKFTLWEEAANSPLIIAHPGQDQAGLHVTTPVSFTQIFATVTDLLGIEAPESVTAPSFAGLIDVSFGPYSGGPVLTTIFGSLSMRWGDFRFIRYEDGSLELYDLTIDPGQTINLAANPDQDALVATCLQTMREVALEQGAIFDDDGQQLIGGVGSDRLIAKSEVVLCAGGDGDDTYFIENGTTVIEMAGAGVDSVVMRAGLGSANVRYVLPDNVEDYQDGIGIDSSNVRGNSLSNALTGKDGISILYGMKGDDVIFGNRGEDRLYGGTGGDWLFGGRENDFLFGGHGNDLLEGGLGDDVFIAGKGNDLIETGSGPDRVIIRPGDGREIVANISAVDGMTPLSACFDPSKDVLVFDGFTFSDAAEVLDLFVDRRNGAFLEAEGMKLMLWGISSADLTAACIEVTPTALDPGL